MPPAAPPPDGAFGASLPLLMIALASTGMAWLGAGGGCGCCREMLSSTSLLVKGIATAVTSYAGGYGIHRATEAAAPGDEDTLGNGGSVDGATAVEPASASKPLTTMGMARQPGRRKLRGSRTAFMRHVDATDSSEEEVEGEGVPAATENAKVGDGDNDFEANVSVDVDMKQTETPRGEPGSASPSGAGPRPHPRSMHPMPVRLNSTSTFDDDDPFDL